MTDYLTNDTDLTSVADAIREKGGTSEPLEWPSGYVDAIEAIETGGGGASQYVVGVSPNVSQTYYFKVSPAVCGEGDTVTVTHMQNATKPIPPGSGFGITDIDGATLAVLYTAISIKYQTSFTFQMPAQDVILSIVDAM